MVTNKGAYEDDTSLKLFDSSYFTPGIREYLTAENQFIMERVSDSASLLEVGCGPGHYLKKLAPHIKKIVGIDVAAQMVEIAQSATESFPNVSVMECTAEDLPKFITEPFDTATLTWNTFGNMDAENHLLILQNIAQIVTKHVFLSVYRIGENVVQERIAYYHNLGFEIEEVRDNDVVYLVGGAKLVATAFPDSYYKTVLTEAGFVPTIHNISSCGKIVEGAKIN